MNQPTRDYRCLFAALAVAIVLGGCSAPLSPPAAPTAPAAAPSASRPPSQSAGPPAARPADAPSESDWRRALAQHILTVNREQVFEGRPPNPLKAVVVLELTVGADGRVQNASVMRAPGHASDLGPVAVRTARAASPLPPPPRALLGRGTSVRFTETWLFRQDNRFQLRTLAQAQL